MKMKRLLLGFIMIASVALAGCGGGGGTSLMLASGERPTQADITALEAALTAAQGASDAAQADVDSLTTMRNTAQAEVTRLTDELAAAPTEAQVTELTTMRNTAQAEVTRLTDELAAAPTAEQVTMLTMERNTAQAEVTRLTDELAAAPTAEQVTMLTMERNTAQAEVTRLTMELEEANEKLARLDDDIELARLKERSDKAGQFLPAVLMPESADFEVNAMTTAALNSDGTLTVKLSPDGEGDSAYTQTTDSPVGLGGAWNEVILKNDPVGEDETDNVAFYTNAEGKVDKALLEAETEVVNGIFPVQDGATAVADFGKNAASDAFPSAPETGSTVVLLGDPETLPGTSTVRLEFSGMWREVPGKFISSGTDKLEVGAMMNEDGEEVITPVFGNNTWSFLPDNAKATVKVDDEDYLYLGWWHRVPDAADTVMHDFEAFAGGKDPFRTTAVDEEGTASYSGRATGKYAYESGPRTSPTYVAESFTANASMTAEFGDTTNTIQGEVTGFSYYDVDGNAVNDNIGRVSQITLGEIEIQDTALDSPFTSTDGTSAVAKIGTGESTAGEWGGQFFGNARDDGEPGSVAGTFNAQFDTHTGIAGAYGATHE